ncbi:MAG TPA: transposase [Planctomycetaceae bacterium]|nr:transposase [Planctomycetaceae bacterium]
MQGFDRYWHLTWTTYGQWLPGDERGSVTRIRMPDEEHRIEEDQFGTPRTPPIPRLNEAAQDALVGPPIFLTKPQAEQLLLQFHETCGYRKWLLVATAIMANHTHALLGVPGDPEPEDLLRDLKSWGSRKLNKFYGKPASGTWWTESGSRRKKPDLSAIFNAIDYIKDQENPLVIWINPITETWR